MNKRFLAIVTILLMVMTIILPANNVFADELTNPYFINGNDKDIEGQVGKNILEGLTSYKVPDDFTNSKFADGLYISNDGKLQVNLTFSDPDSEGPRQVSWTPAPGNQVEICYVFVKAADGGYLYSYDGSGDIFNNLHGIEGHALSHITFYCRPITQPTTYSINVLKVDKSDGSVITSGAEFTLTKDGDTAFSKAITTGTDGYAVFSNLEAGTYHLKETKAPDGYDLSTEVKDITLPGSNGNVEISFADTKTSPKIYSIKVLKVDKSDGSIITTGAEFTLTKEGNTDFSQTGITGPDGYAAFNNLEAGTYHLRETKAPSEYDLSAEVKDITLPGSNGNVEVSFADTKTPPMTYSIKVIKIDLSDNKTQLPGAEFKLTMDGNKEFSQTGITGSDGTYTFTGLEAGTYYVTETKAPAGYEIATTSQTVSVPFNDGNAEVKFYDSRHITFRYSITAVKVDENDNSKLQGAEFTLTKQYDTSFNQTGITGSDGIVTFNNLLAGTYYVEETKAPAGYEISKKVETIVLPSSNGDALVTFNDKKQIVEKYSIKIFKVDTSDKNKKLVGAEFTLTKDGDKSFTQTGITGADGSVTFDNLTAGTYYVEETKAPEGYEVSTINQTVTLPSQDKNVEITFYDDPSKNEIPIINEPIPGAGNEIPIINEPIPGAGPVLPKTGELPPELFYGFGAAFVLLGIYLKKRK